MSFRFVDNPIAAIAIVKKIFDANLIMLIVSFQYEGKMSYCKFLATVEADQNKPLL